MKSGKHPKWYQVISSLVSNQQNKKEEAFKCQVPNQNLSEKLERVHIPIRGRTSFTLSPPKDICNVITKKSKFPFSARHLSTPGSLLGPLLTFPWVGYRSPPKKCPWPVRQAVLGGLLDVVGCTTHRAFPSLGIRWGSAPLGTSANSSVAGDFIVCL